MIRFNHRANDRVNTILHQNRLLAITGHFCGNLEYFTSAALPIDVDTLNMGGSDSYY